MPDAPRAGFSRRQVLGTCAAVALTGGAGGVLWRRATDLARIGFGAKAQGGDGGPVVLVTSLDDDGPGTLREALEAVDGPRIVRFGRAGTIHLSREIRIVKPYLTLDGTTAPGPGVTVIGARLRVETQEVIITGMQLRPGDDRDGDTPNNRDALSLGDGARAVLVVANSFTWALDENVSLWGDVRDVTLAYNIVGEALRDSIHVDENATRPAPHSMGMIVGSADPDGVPERVTIARNLFVSNDYRNPYVQTGRQVEVVCNLIVNHGAGHQAMSVGDGRFPCVALLAGNVVWPGADTRRDLRPPLDLTGLPEGGALYLGDNSVSACDAAGCAGVVPIAHGRLDRLSAHPAFAGTHAGDLALADVPRHILGLAGAHDANGVLRPVDAHLIRAVREDRSRIIDRPRDSAGLD